MNFAVARVVFGRAKTIPYSLITAGNYETQIMGVKKNKFIVQNMPINPQRYRRVFSVDSKKKKNPYSTLRIERPAPGENSSASRWSRNRGSHENGFAVYTVVQPVGGPRTIRTTSPYTMSYSGALCRLDRRCVLARGAPGGGHVGVLRHVDEQLRLVLGGGGGGVVLEVRRRRRRGRRSGQRARDPGRAPDRRGGQRSRRPPARRFRLLRDGLGRRGA